MKYVILLGFGFVAGYLFREYQIVIDNVNEQMNGWEGGPNY